MAADGARSSIMRPTTASNKNKFKHSPAFTLAMRDLLMYNNRVVWCGNLHHNKERIETINMFKVLWHECDTHTVQ